MAHRQRPPARRGAGRPRRRGAALDRATAAPVLISGYYGFGNLGDEAVLAGLLVGLRACLPDARPVVLSADPEATQAVHGVEAASRSPVGVWRALAGARLLVSGGGSLVQDVTSARSALYYLGAMLAASWRGVPVAVVGQGVGPLRRSWVRRLAGHAFRRASAVGVRDQESARALEALGVRSVHIGADLAFLAPAAAPERGEAILRRAGLLAGSPVIGMAVRAWPGVMDPATLGGLVGGVAARRGAAVAALVLDRRRDRAASETAAAAGGGRVIEVDTPADLLGVVGRMELVVGVRLHATILAAAQAVPAVAIAYDPKVAAFMAQAGLPGVVPGGDPPQVLEQALEAVWSMRGDVRARLRARHSAWQAAAAASAALAAEALRGR